MDVSRAKVLVYDQGMFPYVAQAIAEHAAEVWYYTPWLQSFTQSRRILPGMGLEGIERVNHVWDYVDQADVIVFPDVGRGDFQRWLRDHNHRVWGSAESEILELDRVGLHEWMDSKEMPHPPYVIVEGVAKLREHLAEHDDRYVKVSTFRGDFETYHHINAWLSEPWLTSIAHQLGPLANAIQFVVETPIEGAEVGYDGWCIDGQFPSTALYGYEAKDAAYIGRVCRYDKMPSAIRWVNDQMSDALRDLGCRGLVSTELRVTPEGDAVLMDPCQRAGSPPSEGMMVIVTNWAEIMLEGADGALVPPVTVDRYVAQLMLRSEWTDTEFLALRFPDEHRHLIKLHYHAVINGTDYVVSPGVGLAPFIGAAVGIGPTLDAATAQAIEVAKSIEGYQLEYDVNAFHKIEETIAQGEAAGITWD